MCTHLTALRVQADEPAAPTAALTEHVSTSNAGRLLPAGAEIPLRLIETVGSNTHARGARFKLEVLRDVLVDDAIVIRAGAQAEGEVIHAAKRGMAGKPGELIVTVRWVQAGEQRLKMRSFVARNGEDRYNLANGLSIALGFTGLFVVGKDIVVPADTEVFAKLAENALFPAVEEEAPTISTEPILDVTTSPGEVGNETIAH